MNIVQALVAEKLARNPSMARRLICTGRVTVNAVEMVNIDAQVETGDVLRVAVGLRRGLGTVLEAED